MNEDASTLNAAHTLLFWQKSSFMLPFSLRSLEFMLPSFIVMLPSAVTVPFVTVPNIVTFFLDVTENPSITLPLTMMSPMKSILPLDTSTSPRIRRDSSMQNEPFVYARLPSTEAIISVPSFTSSVPLPTLNLAGTPCFCATGFPMMSVPGVPSVGGVIFAIGVPW